MKTTIDRKAAIEAFTGPGRPYEMTTATVDGTEYRVFVNAPGNLCELYRSGLQFADRDFFGGGDVVEITQGLRAGERVVVEGTFTLKSTARQGELGGGHSH